MAGGGLSLVKELRHPILKSILAKDVVQFKAKYAAYEHQIDELNVHRTPSTQLKPMELQHCIDPPLLKPFLRLGVFNAHVEQVAGESNTIDNITELNHDVVKVWLEDRSMVDEADIAARVSMALSEVKYKPNRADALGAVTTFFADILTKLEEHGCDIVVDTTGKELARQVLPLIQPKSVRDVLDTEWKFWAPKDKNDFMKFQKYVTASVVEAAKWTNKRGFEAEETGDPEGSSNKKRRGAGGSQAQKQQGKHGNGDTAKALADWFATIGVVLNWVSDRGSHFKNEVVERLREQNRASHRFTLAYAPWSNGTVEVVNREVLRVLRALCSELRIAFKEWPNILPVVQGVLNSAVLPRLGDRSPLTVMTGLPADTPLASITTSQDEQPRAIDVSRLKALQRRAIDGALSALGVMHKEVKEKQTAARQSKIDAHNKRTHVRPCNFGVGDYVLRGVRAGQHRSKLALRWTGPYRVVKVLSDFVFVLEHLLSGEKAEVHGTRITLFRNASFEVTEEVLGHIKHQEGELHNIAEFAGFRTHQGIPQVKVRWQGFEADEDSWEDIKLIKEDVPVLFGKHVKECRKSGSAKHKEFLRAHRL